MSTTLQVQHPLPASRSGAATTRRSHVRYGVLLMIFVVTTVNYADRATLSITGPAMSKEFGFGAILMGYMFSAFSWAYVLSQLPGGWLLDRFGARRVYAASIFFWSVFTLMQASVGVLTSAATAVVTLFAMRCLVGVAESPAFPANSKVVASWFPSQERGTASAIFNAAQYFAAVVATPVMVVVTHLYGWHWVYIGQFSINVLTYFFLTWFPVYLVEQRHMTILKAGFMVSVPAICGFIGGVLGGVISDYLLRKSGSLNLARKIPIVVGMLMSMSMILCNYVNVDWIIVAIMALAFFGKGMGALGWAVMSDVAPKEVVGLAGSIFNTFGNVAGIVTPIVIGYILAATGSFNGALVFVALNALVTVFAYLVIVQDIKRIELKH